MGFKLKKLLKAPVQMLKNPGQAFKYGVHTLKKPGALFKNPKALLMPIQTTGTRGYLEWLKTRQPRVYADVTTKWADLPQLSGIGAISDPFAATPSGPASPGIVNTLQSLVTTASQIYLTKQQLDAQRDITRMQLDRASRGLAPLDIDPYQYGLAPTARVGLTGDTSRLLLIGGGILAAVFLLPKLLGSRK